MSDSDAGPAQVSAAKIEKALRDAVIDIWKSGNTYDLTVKRVRTVAEQELDLPKEFLKGADWKTKSHQIIHNQVDQCQNDNAPSSPASEPSPPKKKAAPAKPTPKPKAAPKKAKAADPPRGVKRKSPASKPKPQKRRKVVSSDEDEESDAPDSVQSPSDSDLEDGPTKPTRRAAAKVKKVDSDEEMSDASAGNGSKTSDDESSQKKETKASKATKDVSESELSDVLDEPPPKAPRTKKATSGPKPRESKPKPVGKDLTPQEAEIKQLQSHLVSCGIKKVWARYLAPYDTPKEKISHLKELLRDAGMDGRYTLEKAQKIKAKRELDAELNAVQEGAKAWGNPEDVGGRPRRAAARASKPVAPIKFDSDDSGEEEDGGDGDSDDAVEDNGDGEDDEDEESEESAFSGSDSD
ncbi:uncharacterized protein BDZ99DRAFT_447243 [Mytilinidion resinicola]|uniref:Transcriptional regulator n=1 Tax=Mytilinidion resinicola TaxID=574789 RepID=A0A6A6YHL4_9PEZI|nr:uncharacterized protein BDZ99DRAFT_447243 [Mytilinidion resinicola]KAF2808079.1 hypothetical protein BDZ99DRAFT_447243 [Mytilinidion resinicola]